MKYGKLYLTFALGAVFFFVLVIVIGVIGGIWLDSIEQEKAYKLADTELFRPGQFQLFMAGEGLRNGEIVHIKKVNHYGEVDSVKVRISTLPLIFAQEAGNMEVLNLKGEETLRLDANGNVWRQVEPGDTISKMVDFCEPNELYVVDAFELKGNYNGQEMAISRPVLRKIN